MYLLQKQVDDFMKEMGWPYFTKEKILAKIEEEREELDIEIKNGESDKAEIEFGDLVFAYCCLCNSGNIDEETFEPIFKTLLMFGESLGINPEEALSKAIKKDRIRDKDRYKKESVK